MDHALEALAAERGAVKPASPASATARSDAATFVRWVTQRGDRQSLGMDADGDARTLAVLPRLKVF